MGEESRCPCGPRQTRSKIISTLLGSQDNLPTITALIHTDSRLPPASTRRVAWPTLEQERMIVRVPSSRLSCSSPSRIPCSRAISTRFIPSPRTFELFSDRGWRMRTKMNPSQQFPGPTKSMEGHLVLVILQRVSVRVSRANSPQSDLSRMQSSVLRLQDTASLPRPSDLGAPTSSSRASTPPSPPAPSTSTTDSTTPSSLPPSSTTPRMSSSPSGRRRLTRFSST
mmetsp:Transcript_4281/g.10379  ORF Transcript_4281/g.10379 Transcript_4281/m.10379 type:complete len:226 (-) Transcript_4281:1183-1860(-)